MPGSPMPPGRPAKQSKAGLWIVLLLVLVVGSGAALFLVFGGGEGSSSQAGGRGNSPAEQAVWDFVKASDAQNCAALLDLVSDASIVGGAEGAVPDRQAEADRCEQQVAAGEEMASAFPPESEIDSVEAQAEGAETATVTVTSGDESLDLEMVKQDGKWRIDFYNSDAFSAEGGPGAPGSGEGG